MCDLNFKNDFTFILQMEIMSLQLLKENIAFGVCGMFYMNREFTLLILTTSLVNFIILVQFQYIF